jgi:hypothetical protein
VAVAVQISVAVVVLVDTEHQPLLQHQKFLSQSLLEAAVLLVLLVVTAF